MEHNSNDKVQEQVELLLSNLMALATGTAEDIKTAAVLKVLRKAPTEALEEFGRMGSFITGEKPVPTSLAELQSVCPNLTNSDSLLTLLGEAADYMRKNPKLADTVNTIKAFI